jgi:hypothetical protein
MGLTEKVDIEIGLDGSFEFAMHVIAIRKVVLVVDGIEKAKELVIIMKHEDGAFGLETDQAVFCKPGQQVIIPGLVAVLATIQRLAKSGKRAAHSFSNVVTVRSAASKGL